MKSTTSELKVITANPFPKLMEAEDETIVLFSASRKGTCVHYITGQTLLGGYYDNWNMLVFTDYNGSVTLSND